MTDRCGVDLNPLDPHNAEDALRLRAYLWADQAHRVALTDAAIALNSATVDRGDAVDWLEQRLTGAPRGQMHLITVAWCISAWNGRRPGKALIEAAGARATLDDPVAWLRMEADGATPGASVTARLWPGDHALTFGRADFHDRWVDWSPDPD